MAQSLSWNRPAKFNQSTNRPPFHARGGLPRRKTRINNRWNQKRNQSLQVDNLYLQLAYMPSAEELPRNQPNVPGNTIETNIRKTCRKIMSILSQLKEFGENLSEQRMLLITVLSKLPKPVYNSCLEEYTAEPIHMQMDYVSNLL